MPIKLANNASGTLATAISASDTGIALTTGNGALFPTLAAGEYFYATLTSTAGTQEIVKATARSGDSLTVVRAQEGTSAQSFAAGARFELRVTAASVEDLVNEYDDALRADLAAAGGAALIGNTPAGTIAATTVQGALNELGTEKTTLTGVLARLDDNDGASLVGYIPSGIGAVATSVQTHLRKLDEELYPYDSHVQVDVLIVYGQSNARGYANNTPGDPVYKTPLARVWNGSTFIPLTSYTPSVNDGTSTGSAWAAFGNEYCKQTGRQLVIVNAAKVSQSIADLQKGTTSYTNLTTWVNGAKAAIVTEGNVVGEILVAFNQGERDSQLKTTPAAYTTSLTQLWTDMKADFSATMLGIFTVGYYADSNLLWGQAIQQAQRLFARNNTDAFLAYDYLGCFGSHNKLKVDSVHYNQRGYNIMGREGAKRFASLLFPDTNAPDTDQLIERFGRLNINQSQSWNLHAAVIQKGSVEPGWSVSHTSPRSHSMILDVDATTSDSVLSVRLACPARTILSFNAEFGGSLKANNVRAIIGSGLSPTSWAAPNADGVSIVPITFVADLSIRLNMATQVMDNVVMSSSLASMIDQISATWGTGTVTVTHPTVTGFPSANIVGSVGRTIRINASTSSTAIQVRDAADALVNDTVHLVLRNVPIRHIDIPTTSELSLQIIAADYAVW